MASASVAKPLEPVTQLSIDEMQLDSAQRMVNQKTCTRS